MQRTVVEKVGSIGAIIAALACPICFPKLALVGLAVGLGVLAPYEGYMAKGVQVLIRTAGSCHCPRSQLCFYSAATTSFLQAYCCRYHF
jgi:hypothetical protein